MKKIIIAAMFSFVLLAIAPSAHAQCAMCKATAETSNGAGSKDVAGINRGILYLLGAPYTLTMIVGGVWYYQRRKAQKANS